MELIVKEEDPIYLSKSSTESFISCNKKFEFKYIKKIRADQSDNEAALFGNVIHSVLERYFKGSKKHDLITLFKDEFKKSEIIGQKFYFLGNALLHEYAKDVDKGNKIIGLEQDFKLYLDNGIPVKGFIDRIDEISEDEIEIVDYKTGYSPPLTPQELENDIQLGIYNLAVNILFPKYKKVKLSLHYLHYGKVSCYRTPQQLEALKDYLGVIYAKISDKVESGEEFKAKINSYCSFCDYKRDCSEFQKVIKDSENAKEMEKSYAGLIVKESGLTVELDQVDVFLKAVQSKMKILKKLEEDVKEFIKGYIKENNTEGKGVKIGSTYYNLTNKRYTDYEADVVLQLCSERNIAPDLVLNVRKAEVDKIFGDPEAKKRLNENAKKSFSNSFVK